MEPTTAGGLVKVANGGAGLDGIVFDTPSRAKVWWRSWTRRGPVLRTFDLRTLTERTEEGPDDRALRLLIRRTPPPVHGRAGAAATAGRGSRGHSRGTMHRTTGK